MEKQDLLVSDGRLFRSFRSANKSNIQNLVGSMRARLKALWNRLKRLRKRVGTEGKLSLGLTICDGEVSRRRFVIAQGRRTEHIAVLGKTGTGKSSLLRSL